VIPASTPAWITTPSGKCFAWYHPPAADKARSCAVLLCDPFGWHRMVLHSLYRQLALRLAGEGFPVLRIDYPGTCDSEGHPRDVARVEAWLAALSCGADHLRTWSGARQLALFGALLGGTLATLLAARRADVAGLALWGPYPQGRVMVRTELAAAATRAATAGAAPGFAAGDQEAFGFLLTAPMLEDLRAIDLAALRPAGVRRALVLPRAAGGGEKKLAEQLAAAGAEVDCRAAPEHLDAVLHENGAGHAPRTLQEVASWLAGAFPERSEVPAPASLAGAEAGLTLAAARETPVSIGPGAIFGILAEPRESAPRLPAVVLVSGGHNHRAGINRNYTEWSRRLAARGHAVLRMDLRGLGDSPPATPGGLGRLYTEDGTQDVVDAVAWLRARGYERVCCVGLCAGGSQAFQAALKSPDISAIVMLNPLRFHADRADAPPARGLAGLLRRVVRRLPRALRAWGSAERRIAGSFAELAGRGVDVLIVYNANEHYREFLEGALHPVRRKLAAGRRFRLRTVGASDHIFSPLWAQAEVGDVLEAHVGELSRPR
jgi:dienelactone hydrolase